MIFLICVVLRRRHVVVVLRLLEHHPFPCLTSALGTAAASVA